MQGLLQIIICEREKDFDHSVCDIWDRSSNQEPKQTFGGGCAEAEEAAGKLRERQNDHRTDDTDAGVIQCSHEACQADIANPNAPVLVAWTFQPTAQQVEESPVLYAVNADFPYVPPDIVHPYPRLELPDGSAARRLLFVHVWQMIVRVNMPRFTMAPV